MATTTDDAGTMTEGDKGYLRRDSARRAIVMAVVLCAGIAGGILLSESYDDRLAGYGDHAASYLADGTGIDQATTAGQPATDIPPVTTVSAGGGTETVCKAYTKEVIMGGQLETIHGTACRQSDGTWDIVE